MKTATQLLRPWQRRVKVATFNVLAPCYHIIEGGKTESRDEARWRKRHEEQCLASLRTIDADVVCLQEYWFHPPFMQLYSSTFEKLGFAEERAKRSGKKADGLAIFYRKQSGAHKPSLRVLDTRPIEFRDCGNRVALLVLFQCVETGGCFVVVNTHLTFPHHNADVAMRLEQVRKVTAYIDHYVHRSLPSFFSFSSPSTSSSSSQEAKEALIPVILAGDFNGGEEDSVYRHLILGDRKKKTKQNHNNNHGTTSSITTRARTSTTTMTNNYSSTFALRHGREVGVTHRNHEDNDVGVDFIWLRHFDLKKEAQREKDEEAAEEEEEEEEERKRNKRVMRWLLGQNLHCSKETMRVLMEQVKDDDEEFKDEDERNSTKTERKERRTGQEASSSSSSSSPSSSSTLLQKPVFKSSKLIVEDSWAHPPNIPDERWPPASSTNVGRLACGSDHRPVVTTFILEATSAAPQQQ
ncbi:Endo/exonuclease/phosphatase domain-containing protein [Balamuthia mandrillaris]